MQNMFLPSPIPTAAQPALQAAEHNIVAKQHTVAPAIRFAQYYHLAAIPQTLEHILLVSASQA
jgi:hypothetical protein